jgi:type IV secretory pathway VirB9-like protein
MQTGKRLFLSSLACGYLIAGEVPKPLVDASPRIDPAVAARTVEYREKEVTEVRTRLRYTTVFVLPKSEKIMDFVCGDKDNWAINGADNFAYVKPEKEKARTNLNLVAASGNVYSFLLIEGEGLPDLKIFVQPKDESMLTASAAPAKWVPASDLNTLRVQAEAAREDASRAQEAAAKSVAEQIDAFRSAYPSRLKHVYRFADRKPFQVSAIAHDDKFTYIWANPQETPVLYEIKDGKPNLISFEFRNGMYVVNKVLEDGYLSVGKQRLDFRREE